MKMQPAGSFGIPDGGVQPPQTFVRSLTTPSGLPWEQARAAELEARMSAPATLSALQYRLVRVEPWSFGKVGRFAAVYLRGGEEGHIAEINLEGRALKVSFLSEAAKRRAALTHIRGLAILGLPAFLMAAAVTMSLTTAADRENRIELLEAKAQRAEITAKRLMVRRAEGQALRAAGVEGRTAADALSDLTWLARARSPDAHIQAVHWEGGLMTVTTRGETPPVRAPDRELRKAERPLAPYVYLWGIGPGGRAAR